MCLQAGTSDFIALSVSDSGLEEEESANVEEPSLLREPLAPLGSQMTVPETPSPDVLELK